MGYFSILGAIPGFFLSSLFFWLLWGPVARRLGLPMDDISYPTSMLVVITLWIAVAPLVTTRSGKKKS
jgi:hypothetical protein